MSLKTSNKFIACINFITENNKNLSTKRDLFGKNILQNRVEFINFMYRELSSVDKYIELYFLKKYRYIDKRIKSINSISDIPREKILAIFENTPLLYLQRYNDFSIVNAVTEGLFNFNQIKRENLEDVIYYNNSKLPGFKEIPEREYYILNHSKHKTHIDLLYDDYQFLMVLCYIYLFKIRPNNKVTFEGFISSRTRK